MPHDSHVDGLSLAMFEALRGLRDAVAPESGNLGGNTGSTESAEPDMEELWGLYRAGDKDITAMIHKASGGATIQKREDFVRLYAKMEMEKDTELVTKLASTVLEKSAQIDLQLDSLPGINRTRQEQMKRIEELIVQNKSSSEELDSAYKLARQRRDSCRAYVKESTSVALGIEEEVGR